LYQYSFQKLRIWQDSIWIFKQIYRLTSTWPSEEKFGLTSQIRRAIVSVSSNIAEGVSRKSYKDQARMIQIAYSSLMEVVSQLELAKALGYFKEEHELYTRINKLSNMINSYYNNRMSKVEEDETEYESPNPQINKSTNTELIDFEDIQFHFTAFIDQPSQIGAGTKIWHFTHIMQNSVIGKNCNIGQNVVVSPKVVLGNNVKVQNNVSIYTGVICEDHVFLGPSMVFTNVVNPRSEVNRKSEYKKTLVKQGATIGANATIVCGVTIGKYAFVGAGAVITKDVSDYSLMVGNPAQQIGWMSEFGHRLIFDDAGIAICPESRDNYKLENDQVKILE